jgi:hypothetical protein
MQKKKFELDKQLIQLNNKNGILQTTPDSISTFTFKVPTSYKIAYKTFCAKNNLSLTDAFKQAFSLLEEKHK